MDLNDKGDIKGMQSESEEFDLFIGSFRLNFAHLYLFILFSFGNHNKQIISAQFDTLFLLSGYDDYRLLL